MVGFSSLAIFDSSRLTFGGRNYSMCVAAAEGYSSKRIFSKARCPDDWLLEGVPGHISKKGYLDAFLARRRALRGVDCVLRESVPTLA